MPKLKKSAKESNWAPKSLVEFRNLANLPSTPSKKAEIIIKAVAKIHCSLIAERMADKPTHRAIKVTILGSSFAKGK